MWWNYIGFFLTTYYVGKKRLYFFPNFLIFVNYLYEWKVLSGWIFFFFISNVVKKKVLNIIQNSKNIGIMINESTNISNIGHLMNFVTSIEKGLPMAIFFGFVGNYWWQKNVSNFFECFLSNIKEWDLNLDQCITFKLDEVVTMVAQRTWVATVLKQKKNPSSFKCILLSIEPILQPLKLHFAMWCHFQRSWFFVEFQC